LTCVAAPSPLGLLSAWPWVPLFLPFPSPVSLLPPSLEWVSPRAISEASGVTVPRLRAETPGLSPSTPAPGPQGLCDHSMGCLGSLTTCQLSSPPLVRPCHPAWGSPDPWEPPWVLESLSCPWIISRTHVHLKALPPLSCPHHPRLCLTHVTAYLSPPRTLVFTWTPTFYMFLHSGHS
jgi:hypothetical protein